MKVRRKNWKITSASAYWNAPRSGREESDASGSSLLMREG